MRLGVVLCVATLMLVGCTSGATMTSRSQGEVDSPVPSAVTSLGADVPADNPSLKRADRAGQSPGESVVALVEALNDSAWQTAYSSYASPSADFATAAREWNAAPETYLDFRVLEVRVTSTDTSWVRVAYAVTTDAKSSAIPPVAVEEPGEWWPVHKVGGLWKTRWMPRQ